MENKFNKGPSTPSFNIEDIKKFGKLLSRARFNLEKSIKLVASELSSVNSTAISRWESGEIFPEKDKLPAIAEAYGINSDELKEVFAISKKAREEEKKVRQGIFYTGKGI